MQTAIGTTNGRPGTTYYQRGRMHRHQPGNRQQKEKKAAAGRNRNDFLTGRILPVTPDYYMESRAGEKINLTTRENFDFLYRSALRYSGLVGLRLPFRPTRKSPRMNIIKLYRAMDTILRSMSTWKRRTEGCTSASTGSMSGRSINCSGYRWNSRRDCRKNSEG